MSHRRAALGQKYSSRLVVAPLGVSLLLLACIQRQPECTPVAGTASAGTPNGASVAAPAGGTSVLAGEDAFEAHGDTAKVVVSKVPVEGQPFARAVRAEIKAASGSEWSVQMQAKTTTAIASSDVLLATFYVRSLKPQEGGITETQFVFERAGSPYTKSVTYPLRVTPEWRKVQIRFKSLEAYAPGEAQMIFRLGYEPETFEVGGISVQNYAKSVELNALPHTETLDHRLATTPLPKEPPLPAIDGGELPLTVSTNKVIRPISPYVYGINAQNIDDTGTSQRRLGGNRGSVYNWELNASNAGNDYRHVNDDWPCTVMGYNDCGTPGAQYVDFVQQNKRAGVDSIVTIPMQDFVSADKNQSVTEDEKAPSKRFVRSVPKKKGAFSATPDLNDGTVYQDEFVQLLVQKLGKASNGGARFYSLDNEPALWPSTHPRVHKDRVTYKEIVARTEATAKAISDVDATATILGGVMFGWSEFMSLSSAPDSAEFDAKYGNYVEYFLASLKELEQKHGRRLVHVLDVHWYPESRGTKRITEEDVSRKTIAARLEAPRSLWDEKYVEKSWITEQWKKPIRLIPWLHESIAKRYPGTRLGLTEYNFGAGDHISGGLAQADVLGILGREGVYLANYWGPGAGVGPLKPYVTAAFKLYRNYDEKGGRFGDVAVSATTPDPGTSSIYAATDTKKPGTLTVLVINKDQQKNFKAKLSVDSALKYGRAEAFVLDGASAKLRRAGAVTVNDNKIEYALPPLSAVLFVLDKT